MRDNWCAKLVLDDGRIIYGGAARNVRLSRAGGVQQIIDMVGQMVLSGVNQSGRFRL